MLEVAWDAGLSLVFVGIQTVISATKMEGAKSEHGFVGRLSGVVTLVCWSDSFGL